MDLTTMLTQCSLVTSHRAHTRTATMTRPVEALPARDGQGLGQAAEGSFHAVEKPYKADL